MNVDTQQFDDATSAGRSAIREDIEATRSRMGETLEEIGARLNPGRLTQQAKDKVREATIGRVQNMARNTIDKAATAGRTVTDVVRENPIPAALIALGVGWLAFGMRRNASTTSIARYEPQVFEREPRLASRDRLTRSDMDVRSTNARAQSDEGGVVDGMRDKAQAMADATQDVAHRAAEGAANVASSVATTVSETARTQSANVANAFEENPLAIGAIAVALGAAAGFLVPGTRKEAELLGETRDELVEKAREAVSEKKEQAQRVAQRVVTEAKSVATQAARQEGLTG